MTDGTLPPTLRFEGGPDGRFLLLDQTLLPGREVEIEIGDLDTLIDAIQRLAVRGAPAIGVAAAYGSVIAARNLPPERRREELPGTLRRLAEARPTAVNLVWAVRRLLRTLEDHPDADPADVPALLLAEARAVHEEDRRACEAMARHAGELVRDGGAYLTHCNAGALATGGIGTALGVFHRAARDGKRITVYADETRPLWQGARLTAWELTHAGIDVVVICDSAAAGLLARGGVDAVFVGADRIARNGDVANKVGTLSVALAARHAGVPFYVVAPVSTFDLDLADGGLIPIEERSPDEIVSPFGRRHAPDGVRSANPAFDVTPATLVTAIVTERGLIRPVTEAAVAATVGRC